MIGEDLMKKILGILLVATFLFFIGWNGIGVNAAILSSEESETEVCNRETHYYYFLYPSGQTPKCWETDSSGENFKAPCSGEDNISTVDPASVWQTVIDEKSSSFLTSFEKTTLPEGFKLLQLDTVADTNFTETDYYILFDGLAMKKNRLTSKDTGNTVYSVDESGNVIIVEDENGNKIYYHLHGNWSGGVTTDSEGSIFDYIENTWNQLSSPSERVAYREKIVTDMMNATLTSEAKIGIKLEDGTIQDLTVDNMSRIFDNINKVSIEREIDIDIKPALMEYKDTSTGIEYYTYLAPAKFRAEIGTDCHERTCEDVNAEYEACQADNSCSDELIKEYEACNPVEEVENPDTSEINIPLVCLVVTGMAVLAVSAYQQKKKDVK